MLQKRLLASGLLPVFAAADGAGRNGGGGGAERGAGDSRSDKDKKKRLKSKPRNDTSGSDGKNSDDPPPKIKVSRTPAAPAAAWSASTSMDSTPFRLRKIQKRMYKLEAKRAAAEEDELLDLRFYIERAERKDHEKKNRKKSSRR
eukprot:6182644-Pleurochrysis_carterae.AAC.1